MGGEDEDVPKHPPSRLDPPRRRIGIGGGTRQSARLRIIRNFQAIIPRVADWEAFIFRIRSFVFCLK